MKAALLEAPGKSLVVCDVDIADPGPGQVRVQVAHCGVCHSDLSVVDGSFPNPTPIVLGHEAAGVIDALGDGVEGLALGDQVILTPCPPCGSCYFCLRGEAITSAARYRQSGYWARPVRNLACLALFYLGVAPRFIARLYG